MPYLFWIYCRPTLWHALTRWCLSQSVSPPLGWRRTLAGSELQNKGVEQGCLEALILRRTSDVAASINIINEMLIRCTKRHKRYSQCFNLASCILNSTIYAVSCCYIFMERSMVKLQIPLTQIQIATRQLFAGREWITSKQIWWNGGGPLANSRCLGWRKHAKNLPLVDVWRIFRPLRSQLGGNIRVARLPANGVQDFTLSISAHSIPTQFQQMHRGQTAKSGCMGKPVFPCQIHASIINNTLRQATGMPNAMAKARIMGHAVCTANLNTGRSFTCCNATLVFSVYGCLWDMWHMSSRTKMLHHVAVFSFESLWWTWFKRFKSEKSQCLSARLVS